MYIIIMGSDIMEQSTKKGLIALGAIAAIAGIALSHYTKKIKTQ